MAEVYLVQRSSDYSFLNRKGTWSRTLGSMFIMEFNSEDEAKAAFPQGVDCQVMRLNQSLRGHAPEMPKGGPDFKYCISYRNRFLSQDLTFTEDHPMNAREKAKRFNSLQEAQDYVLTLDQNPDDFRILAYPSRPN